MKKLTLTVITLLSLATPVRSQEVSRYTALNAAIKVYTESFCNAARLGANRTDATEEALNDFYVYLKNMIGEDATIETFKSMNKKRFAYSVVNSIMQSCPSDFVELYGEEGSLPY